MGVALSRELLARIDEAADKLGIDRSAFMVLACRHEIETGIEERAYTRQTEK